MNESESAVIDALISFGSNLGDRHEALAATLEMLLNSPGIRSITASEPVVTRSVGGPEGQPNFLNAAIRVQTTLTPHQLYQRQMEIEQEFGRQRRVRWGSRQVDLDLLLYANHELRADQLVIPHPRMSFRRFVLQPANQVAHGMVHPTSGLTINQLLDHLNSMPDVILIVNPQATRSTWASVLEAALESKKIDSNWKLIHAEPIEFEKDNRSAKLVVFDSSELPIAQRQSVIRFKGPTLNLIGQDNENQKAHEISAAISAMQKV